MRAAGGNRQTTLAPTSPPAARGRDGWQSRRGGRSTPMGALAPADPPRSVSPRARSFETGLGSPRGLPKLTAGLLRARKCVDRTSTVSLCCADGELLAVKSYSKGLLAPRHCLNLRRELCVLAHLRQCGCVHGCPCTHACDRSAPAHLWRSPRRAAAVGARYAPAWSCCEAKRGLPHSGANFAGP